MQIGPPRALNREGLLSSCEQHSYYLFGRLVWVVLAHPVRLVRAPAVGQPWNYDKLFDDLVQHVQGDFEELALVYQDQPPGALDELCLCCSQGKTENRSPGPRVGVGRQSPAGPSARPFDSPSPRD